MAKVQSEYFDAGIQGLEFQAFLTNKWQNQINIVQTGANFRWIII